QEQQRRLDDQDDKEQFGKHEIPAPDRSDQPVLAYSRYSVLMHQRQDEDDDADAVEQRQQLGDQKQLPRLLEQSHPGSQRLSRQLDQHHHKREHPEQPRVLFQDMPHHGWTPWSRTARASVVKMDRSAIGCTSMCRIPTKSPEIWSESRSRLNLVSTKL